jgi:hypothetical protein
MGKIILEFDSIEDAEKAKDALNGTKWRMAMWELDNKLRETTKYGASIYSNKREATEEEIRVTERVREIIRDILMDNELKLD